MSTQSKPRPRPQSTTTTAHWDLDGLVAKYKCSTSIKMVDEPCVADVEWDSNQWKKFYAANKGNADRSSVLRKLATAYTLRFYKYIRAEVPAMAGVEPLSLRESETTKYCCIPLQNRVPAHERTVVRVVEMDLLDAQHLATSLHPRSFVALHNMASNNAPCRGWEKGMEGAEKTLFTRSTLSVLVPGEHYPLGTFQGLHTANVTVFRGAESEGYPFLPRRARWTSDVISLAGCNCRKSPFTDETMLVMQGKLETLFSICFDKEVDVVVLGAFGCGYYNNPPERIAQLYRELIAHYVRYFSHIYIAILDPTSPATVETFARIVTDNTPGNDAACPDLARALRSSSSSRWWEKVYTPDIGRRKCGMRPSTVRDRRLQEAKLCPKGGECPNITNAKHCVEYEHPCHCPWGPECKNTDSTHRLLFVHNKRIWHALRRERSLQALQDAWAREAAAGRVPPERSAAPALELCAKSASGVCRSLPVHELEAQIARFVDAEASIMRRPGTLPAELGSAVVGKAFAAAPGTDNDAARHLTYWTRAKRFVCVYRADTGRFDPGLFQNVAARIGASLILVATKNGSVLGGYTNLSWTADHSSSGGSGGISLIFSLRRANGAYVPQCFEAAADAYCPIKCGGNGNPVFGDGAVDICPDGAMKVVVRTEPAAVANYIVPPGFGLLGDGVNEDEVTMCEVFRVLNGTEPAGTVADEHHVKSSSSSSSSSSSVPSSVPAPAPAPSSVPVAVAAAAAPVVAVAVPAVSAHPQPPPPKTSPSKPFNVGVRHKSPPHSSQLSPPSKPFNVGARHKSPPNVVRKNSQSPPQQLQQQQRQPSPPSVPSASSSSSSTGRQRSPPVIWNRTPSPTSRQESQSMIAMGSKRSPSPPQLLRSVNGVFCARPNNKQQPNRNKRESQKIDPSPANVPGRSSIIGGDLAVMLSSTQDPASLSASASPPCFPVLSSGPCTGLPPQPYFPPSGQYGYNPPEQPMDFGYAPQYPPQPPPPPQQFIPPSISEQPIDDVTRAQPFAPPPPFSPFGQFGQFIPHSNEEQPLPSDDNNEKPLYDEEKPLYDEEKPLYDEEKPLDDEEKPLYDEEKPLDDDEEKPFDNDEEQPLDDEEKPLDNDEEKPLDDDEMPMN